MAKRSHNFIDLKGKIFGRLVALQYHEKERVWECLCDCGNITKVKGDKLRGGRTRSCGCLHLEVAKHRGLANVIHGYKGSPTWNSWSSMRRRCSDPNHVSYPRYGGRGIRVCKRWLKSFQNFLEDMGERPMGKTLDRYPDPDGNYKKNNCRWATPREQANNKGNY